MTIQWRFDDAEPWHVRIDNGSTAAEPGLAPRRRPDDRVELAGLDRDLDQGRGPAKRLLLRRRIRPRGSLRNLLQLQRIFPPRPNRLG